MSAAQPGRVRAWVADQGPLGCLAWGLLLVAFAASFTHLKEFAETHGQEGMLAVAFALLPDLLVWASLTKLRTEELTGAGWFAVAVTLVLSVAGTLAANLATAKAGTGGQVETADRLTAIAPVVGAILATILAEVRGEPRNAPQQSTEPITAPISVPVTVPAEPATGGAMQTVMQTAGEPIETSAADAPAPFEASTVAAPAAPAPTRRQPPRRKPATPARATDADLIARVTAEVEAGELTPDAVTGNRLRALLGVGAPRATRLAGAWQEQHRRAAIRPVRSATASD